jgi:hypothetical protein
MAPVAFTAPMPLPQQPQPDEEDYQYADGDVIMKELDQKEWDKIGGKWS